MFKCIFELHMWKDARKLCDGGEAADITSATYEKPNKHNDKLWWKCAQQQTEDTELTNSIDDFNCHMSIWKIIFLNETIGDNGSGRFDDI